MYQSVARTNKERIERVELRKTVKKRIQSDIRGYDEKQIQKILRGTGSTKKVKKMLWPNQALMPRINHAKGIKEYNRSEIVRTNCHRIL